MYRQFTRANSGLYAAKRVNASVFLRKNFIHATSIAEYKKTIGQVSPSLLKDANVLVRVDFNVPLSKTDGTTITDDTRIREALPTINHLIDAGAKVVLASHCGRPKGQVNEKMRMAPMAARLGELLKKPIATVDDCVGPSVTEAVSR